jgi:hypothetical protein
VERVLASPEELRRASCNGVDAGAWSLFDVVEDLGELHLRTCGELEGKHCSVVSAADALSLSNCPTCLGDQWAARRSADTTSSGRFEVLLWLSRGEEALERAERGEDLRGLGGALATAQGAASAALARLSGDEGLVRWQARIDERGEAAREALRSRLLTEEGNSALSGWVRAELGPRELTSAPHHGRVLVMTGLGWEQRDDELADAVLVVLEASRVLVDDDLHRLQGSSVALRVSAETADLMEDLGLIEAEVPCEDEEVEVVQTAVQLWREAGSGLDPERGLDWALEVARELL